MVDVPQDRLSQALAEFDPGDRALLDLSLRRSIPDEEIAKLIGTDPDQIASRREQALERLGDELDITDPAERAMLPELLAEAPPEAWMQAPPGGRGREPAGPGDDDAAEVEPPAPEEEPIEDDGLAVAGMSGGRAARLERERAAAGGPSEPPPDPAGSADTERRRDRGGIALLVLGLAALAVVAVIALSSDGGDGEGDRAAQTGERSGGDAEEPGGTDGSGAATTGEPGSPRERPPRSRPRRRSRPAGPPRSASLRPLGGFAGSGTVRLRGEGDGSILRIDIEGSGSRDGAPEVWLYNSVSDAVSLGRLAGGRRRIDVKLGQDLSRYRFVDVSLEPADGNRNHSGRSVLRAPTRSLLAG